MNRRRGWPERKMGNPGGVDDARWRQSRQVFTTQIQIAHKLMKPCPYDRESNVEKARNQQSCGERYVLWSELERQLQVCACNGGWWSC
jgi:hypothetical protein